MFFPHFPVADCMLFILRFFFLREKFSNLSAVVNGRPNRHFQHYMFTNEQLVITFITIYKTKKSPVAINNEGGKKSLQNKPTIW